MRVLVAMLLGSLPVALLPRTTAWAQAGTVRMTATSLNPRVGENTTVRVELVGHGGLTVPNATCVVDSLPGPPLHMKPNGSGLATGVGAQVVTGRCGGATATLVFNVRPKEVRLTLRKEGLGHGSLFANPFLSYAYDSGTVVTIKARALKGSNFTGWTGCQQEQPAPPDESTCTMNMNQHATLVGWFGPEPKRRDGDDAKGDGAPRAKGRGNGGALLAGVALAGAGAYGLGVYLKNQSLASGSCYSSRTCGISAFTGGCTSCAGTTNAGCDFDGTPSDVGQSCVSGTPCKAGLICVNGRCEAPGRCQ